MRRVLLFAAIILSQVVFAQIPAGIDMNSLSQSDLSKLNISQADIDAFQSQSKGANTSNTEIVVYPDLPKEDSIVAPADEALQEEEEDVYGTSFFSDSKLAVYEKATHVKASDDYVIGIGDEISVNIWGYSEHAGRYQVAKDGSIEAKLVGKIYLKGLKFSDARAIIKRSFGKVYDLKNSQLAIEIVYSKPIRVNLVGKVKKPGTYTVSSLNSAFNVISLAGGITRTGSLRKISVVRNGKIVKNLDVYEFLFSENLNLDFGLADNDYIVVGSQQNVVRVAGNIGVEGLYELLPGEGIKDLVKFSGGLKTSAYSEAIEVVTYRNNEKVLFSVSLDSLENSNKNFELYDGDEVLVNSANGTMRNFVTVIGEFGVSGRYQYKEGEKLLDLINRASGIKYDAFASKGYVKRVNADLTTAYFKFDFSAVVKNPNDPANITLKEFDEIHLMSKRSYVDTFTVEVRGSVRKPIVIDYSENLTLGDLIFLAGGLKSEADPTKIEIARISNFLQAMKSGEATKIVIETVTIDANNPYASDIKINPLDIVYVRATPDYEEQQTISILGEVAYPGDYTLLRKDEKLSELIERAGGLTDWANLSGATLKRKGVGYLTMDLRRLMAGDKDYDYILKEGDVFEIQRSTNIVSIEGAVEFNGLDSNEAIIVPFIKGHRAKYYINKFAAGFDKKAKRKKTIVITQGGRVKRTRNYVFFRIYPKVQNGDVVQAVFKEEKTEKQKESEIDWNQAFENATVKLTSILTLYLLIDRTFGN